MSATLEQSTTASVSSTAQTAGLWERVRPMGRGRLLHKLLIVFLTLSIAPLLLAGFELIRVGDNYIQKEIVGVKLGIAQKVATSVTSYIDDKKNTLQIVHKSTDFLTMNPRRQSEILSNVMNAYPMFMRMAVLDLKGKEITAVNRMGTAVGSRAEERRALRTIRSLGDYVGGVSRSSEGYPQMMLAVPIERIPGMPIGVLVAVVNLIDLSSLVKDLQIDQKDYEKGYVYIVDRRGRRLVAHPHIETLLSTEPPAEISAAALAPEETEVGAMEFADQKQRHFLAAYATVPHLNWRVFFQQPVSEAYRASRQMRQQIALVMVAVAFLTVVVGTWISQKIVGRVQTLQEAMERVGEGHFDVPDVPRSNDEFGALTEKFLWMARSLKDKTLKLVSAQHELQRWNSDLEKRVQDRTRALKEAQDQLIAQEKLAALGQMASVVGHELRNPLAVMNNSIYFLKTKLLTGADAASLDPKLEKHLKIIESEIGKSNTIIRDVLDFARNRALNAAAHKVDELVEKALERIQVPAEVHVDKTLTLGDLEAMVDEDELRQVLVNLMENACQAMVKGGTLTVGTKAYDTMVEVIIGDTGCGIPQEHLSKIFAPFFTTKSRGTGLGLAVVKKIIERHQGTIDVRSKVGEGTQFRILLPIKGVTPSVSASGGTNVR